MAVLTWRNVDAPNFRGSLDGLDTAGRLIGNSTSGLADALGKFGDYQTQQADNATLLNALKYQDAAGLRAGLQSGDVFNGVDQSHVNAATIKNLNGQVTDLLNQQTTQQSLDKGALDLTKTQYDFGRTKQQDTASDNAREAVADLSSIAATQNTQAYADALKKYQPILSQLTPAQQEKLASEHQSLLTGKITNDTNSFNNMTRERDDADNQAALKAFQTLQPVARDNQSMIDAARKQGLSAGALAKLQGMLSGEGFNFKNGPIDGPAAAGVGADGNNKANSMVAGASGSTAFSPDGKSGFDTIYANGKYGAPTAPLTSMTIGDVMDWSNKTLIPATKGKIGLKNDDGTDNTTLGTSAVGAFGLTNGAMETYGPKVLGADWKTQKLTPLNQDALAKAAYEANQGKNMNAIFKSLPNTAVGAYKNVPWEQARMQIAQGESSTGATALQSALNQNQILNNYIQTGSNQRGAQDLGKLGIDPDKWDEAATKKDVSSDVVAHQMSSSGVGGWKGTPPSQILKVIDNVRNTKEAEGLTASQIGMLLQVGDRTLSSSGTGLAGWITRLISNSDSVLPEGQLVNYDGISRLAKNLQTGDAQKQGAKSMMDKQRQQAIKDANTQLEQAGNVLARIRQSKVPVDDATRSTAEANYLLAQTRMIAAQNAGNSPDTQVSGQQEKATARTLQQKAEEDRADRMDQAMREAADPATNPLLQMGF